MSDASLFLTGRFLTSYEDAQQAINSGNLDKAKRIIDSLDEGKKRKITEVCHLDIWEI
jgi:hypothetical protein